MNPLRPLIDAIERRCEKRTLVRLSVGMAILTVLTQVAFVWYAASLGLSLGATAYADDDRTVVVDAEDRAAFERGYSEDREEGWCLFGSTNDTHIRIEGVVHARPLSQSDSEVTFTCVPEAAGQVLAGENPRLVGIAHSHQMENRSYLSRQDFLMWGRTSPFVEVMGVYTEADGVAFFTVESMAAPLEQTIVGNASKPPNG